MASSRMTMSPHESENTTDLTRKITHRCEECDAGENLAFCSACTEVLCDDCWHRKRKHRENRLGPGNMPHEKNSLEIVEKVSKRTAEPQDEVEQNKLHEDDEDTAWIGLDRDIGGDPVLAEYRRYAALMMESAFEGGGRRYPSLVSFIGETAAGKSTLIKLLLNLREHDVGSAGQPAPVIGRGSLEQPTSADVHLYLDPATSMTPHPLLLADCEGFSGGEGDPIATQVTEGVMPHGRPHTAESSRLNQMRPSRAREVTQRPLRWAKREHEGTEEKRKRSYAVAQMYPRIFYAFSDVVVYVLKNPRTLEEVVEKLLKWAHTHRKNSINIPAKPHVIIAINQSHNKTDNELWATEFATVNLLDSTTAKIYKNATFRRYAEEKQNASFQITSMKDLLKCYYFDIHVVRLPDKDRFELLHQQAQTLSKVISVCCEESMEFKRSKRMLPDVDQFGLYLSLAFDHFANSLDVPFDYINASLKHQPPPAAFDDNLSVLVKMTAKNLKLFERRGDASNSKLFDILTPMVASCVMLDCSRKQRFGLSKDWFSSSIAGNEDTSYRKLCAGVISRYCENFIPCDHIVRTAGMIYREPRYCDLRYATHHDTHQPLDRWGKYESGFDRFKYDWPSRIQEKLRELEEAYSQYEGSVMANRAIAHQQCLRRFYRSAGGAHDFKANSVCLCCLSGPPEHRLPCWHMICMDCAREYGRQVAGRLEIDVCPLHDFSDIGRINTSPTVVEIYPPHSGLRVLVLDGGGARGIVELTVMRAIEERLGLPLQSFFDLVIGTSTGGIISLGFGDQLWPVERCITTFKNLVNRAFTPRSLQTNTYLLKYVQRVVKHGKYKTSPIVEALQDAFGKDTVLFGSQRSPRNRRRLKVGVTATTCAGNLSRLLANFYTAGSPASNSGVHNDPALAYQHVRPTNPAYELKVWEAARCTSAAPGYFKSFFRECPSEPFEELMDGGVLQNNPVFIANQEALNIAATHHLSKVPDILLSLGTGLSQDYQTDEKKEKRLQQFREAVRERKPFLVTVFSLIESQIKLNLQCDRRWQMWEQNTCYYAPEWQGKRFRLNPDLGEEPAQMDDYKKVPALERSVQGWLGDRDVIDKIDTIACTLVASSWYFESTGSASPLPQSDNSLLELKGAIKCRLSNIPDDIRGLGRFLERCDRTHHGTVTFIDNEVKGRGIKVAIPIASMIKDGRFDPIPLNPKVSARQDSYSISLSMNGHAYPISGFPRSLIKEDLKMGG